MATGKQMGKKASPKASQDAAPARVALPADCRLAALDALAPALREAAAGDAPALLDGSAVEKVDGAALQLLVAFRRAVSAAGGSARWAGASEVLHESAGLLGLAAELDLPAARPA